MSSLNTKKKSPINLYKNFTDEIIKLIKKSKHSHILKDVNLVEDEKILYYIFDPVLNSTFNNKKYQYWSDEEFIESSKKLDLTLLSFINQTKLNLYRVYIIKTNTEDDRKTLLEAYKEVINFYNKQNLISKLNKWIYESIKSQDEINQIVTKMFIKSNYKDGEFGAKLLDLLFIKEFRTYIIRSIFSLKEKLDLSFIDETYNETFIAKLIDDNLNKELFTLMFNILMMVDIKGDVLIKNNSKNLINNYVKDFYENSSTLKDFLNEIENENKNYPNFENKIKINTILDKDTIKEKSKEFNLIKYNKIDLDELIKKYNDNKKLSFKSSHIMIRLKTFVFIIIQEIYIFLESNKSDKINIVNNFLQGSINLLNNLKFFDYKINEQIIIESDTLNYNYLLNKLDSKIQDIENPDEYLNKNLKNIEFALPKDELKNIDKELYNIKSNISLIITNNLNKTDEDITLFKEILEIVQEKEILNKFFVLFKNINNLDQIIENLEKILNEKSFFNLNPNFKSKTINKMKEIIGNASKEIEYDYLEKNYDKFVSELKKYSLFFDNLLNKILNLDMAKKIKYNIISGKRR